MKSVSNVPPMLLLEEQGRKTKQPTVTSTSSIMRVAVVFLLLLATAVLREDHGKLYSKNLLSFKIMTGTLEQHNKFQAIRRAVVGVTQLHKNVWFKSKTCL